MFRRVGELLDSTNEAEALIDRFEATTQFIADRLGGQPTTSVVVLEWLDPPFSSGHWNPGIISRAGGEEMIGKPLEKSRRIDWNEVAEADPEFLLVSACGFSIDRTEEDLIVLSSHREWQDLRAVRNGRVAVTDGSAYFSRPGPRLEASLRIAAASLNPELFPDFAPRGSWRPVHAQV
jgi:iron complex transport system substrate-binding protein